MKPYLNSTKISLMLADVDGALVTHDKVVTPRARAAVADLRAAHIGFTITSGRPPRGMKMLIDDLKIDTIVAGFNGGVFVKPDLTVIQSRFISRAAAARALEVIGQHKLVGWLYTDTDWFVPDPNGAHVARETWTVKFEAKVLSDFNPLLDRAVKIVGVSDDLKAVAECEAALQSEAAWSSFRRAFTALLSGRNTPRSKQRRCRRVSLQEPAHSPGGHRHSRRYA